MNPTTHVVLNIVSLLAVFVYQCFLFSFVSDILRDCRKNKLLFVLLSACNAGLFALFVILGFSASVGFLALLVLLFVEFSLISKADIVQLLCGSSMVVMHIVSFVLMALVIAAELLNITPDGILHGDGLARHILLWLTCLTMILAMQLLRRVLSLQSIARITTKSKQSVVLAAWTLSVVFYQSFNMLFVLTDHSYGTQVLLTVASTLISMLIFYAIFVYSMKLIDAHIYKRHSDNALDEQKKIDARKALLARQIERDPLTGVYNRKYVIDLLNAMCAPDGASFNVLFIDIDGLKYTNDTYGHEAGDRLITKIAAAVSAAVREQDVLARIGGDEFLLLVPDSFADSAPPIVSRIVSQIARQNATETFLISASLGAIFADDALRAKGPSHILSLADAQMRASKDRFYAKQQGGQSQ